MCFKAGILVPESDWVENERCNWKSYKPENYSQARIIFVKPDLWDEEKRGLFLKPGLGGERTIWLEKLRA